MSVLSRRELLNASGAAVCSSILPALLSSDPQTAHGKSAGTKTVLTPTFNAQYAGWCADRAAFVHSKILTGEATGTHLQHLSQVIRGYSRHLQDTGLDAAFRAVAPKLVSTSNPSAKLSAAAASACRKYTPEITEAHFQKSLQFKVHDADHARSIIQAGGISTFYQATADMISAYSKQVGMSTPISAYQPQRTRGDSAFHPALYRPDSDGGIITNLMLDQDNPEGEALEVGLVGSICKKAGCTIITNIGPTALAGAIVPWLEANMPAFVDGACVATDVAEAIATVVTVGAGVFATPIAIGICVAIASAADFLLADGAAALSVVVNNAIAYLKYYLCST